MTDSMKRARSIVDAWYTPIGVFISDGHLRALDSAIAAALDEAREAGIEEAMQRLAQDMPRYADVLRQAIKPTPQRSEPP